MGKIRAEGISAEWAKFAEEMLGGKQPEKCTEIYSGRNRIFKCEFNGKTIAVKFFSRSLKNRLVYSIFSSKARRSYLYALELKKRGIHTPAPLAYSERRGIFHTLQDSVYICAYEEATELRDYLETGEDAWKVFAHFAATLHEKGILHGDLNNTNVRLNMGSDGTPDFSLIDLNRIKFNPIGTGAKGYAAYRNLTRFSNLTPQFRIFAAEYARARNLPSSETDQIIAVKMQDNIRVDRKRRRRKLLKRIVQSKPRDQKK